MATGRTVKRKRRSVMFWIARLAALLALVWLFDCGAALADAPPALGIFETHNDVGTVLHPGSAQFDEGSKNYTVAGSGENMWAAKDAFQFVWKKASGDLAL